MNGNDSANVILLLIGYPPSLAIVAIYGWFQPWRESWLGRGLFLSWTAMSALLGINLAYRLWGWELLARGGWLRTAVYGFIVASSWLVLTGIVSTLIKRKRDPHV